MVTVILNFSQSSDKQYWAILIAQGYYPSVIYPTLCVVHHHQSQIFECLPGYTANLSNHLITSHLYKQFDTHSQTLLIHSFDESCHKGSY